MRCYTWFACGGVAGELIPVPTGEHIFKKQEAGSKLSPPILPVVSTLSLAVDVPYTSFLQRHVQSPVAAEQLILKAAIKAQRR